MRKDGRWRGVKNGWTAAESGTVLKYCMRWGVASALRRQGDSVMLMSHVVPSPPHFGKVCRLDDERERRRERAPPRKAIFGSENRDFGTLLFLTCDTLAIIP